MSAPHVQTHSVRLGSVVSRPMTHFETGVCRQTTYRYLNAAKIRVCKALRRIVRQHVLGPQFIADLAKSLVELRQR